MNNAETPPIAPPMNMKFSFKRMEPNLFETIRDDITQICRRIGVSRYNNQMPRWVEAVEAYFASNGIDQSYYLQEVSARSGLPYIKDVDALFPKKRLIPRNKKWYFLWIR